MKKYLLFLTLSITVFLSPVVQAQPAGDTITPMAVQSDSTHVPDSLIFNFDGRRVAIATTTVTTAISQGRDIFIEIKKQAAEDPPKTPVQWAILIIGILASTSGLAFLTQVRKVGKQVILFFDKKMSPENFVILISGAISAGITVLWNGNTWDTIFFFGLWPAVFGIATVVYLKWLKPKPKV